MKTYIYILEYVDYNYIDYSDMGNPVGDRYQIGYFTSNELAIKHIDLHLSMPPWDKRENYKIRKVLVDLNKNQKYIYQIYYEYYTYDEENGYTDYYYCLLPQKSLKSCIEFKNKLIKYDFFKKTPKKIYDLEYADKDGFSIYREEINSFNKPGKEIKSRKI